MREEFTKRPEIAGNFNLSMPARLQISLFNKRCSGNYLLKTVEEIADNSLKHLQIQLADTLQFHNFIWREGVSRETALQMASDAGLSWIKSNRKALAFCERSFEHFSLVKWTYWTSSPIFTEKLDFYHELMKHCDDFSRAVDKEIELYFRKAEHDLDRERLTLSRNFILEEIAVSDISQLHSPANEIYPGSRLLPEKFLSSSHEYGQENIRNVNFIELHFKT